MAIAPLDLSQKGQQAPHWNSQIGLVGNVCWLHSAWYSDCWINPTSVICLPIGYMFFVVTFFWKNNSHMLHETLSYTHIKYLHKSYKIGLDNLLRMNSCRYCECLSCQFLFLNWWRFLGWEFKNIGWGLMVFQLDVRQLQFNADAVVKLRFYEFIAIMPWVRSSRFSSWNSDCQNVRSLIFQFNCLIIVGQMLHFLGLEFF